MTYIIDFDSGVKGKIGNIKVSIRWGWEDDKLVNTHIDFDGVDFSKDPSKELRELLKKMYYGVTNLDERFEDIILHTFCIATTECEFYDKLGFKEEEDAVFMISIPFSEFAKYFRPTKTQIDKRRKQVGESKDIHRASNMLLEAPGGKRDRARRATNVNFSTNIETGEGLCKNLLNNLYKDELYELSKELELPVTRKTKKAELCRLLNQYGNFF